jgi:Fe-S-cluster containining protein
MDTCQECGAWCCKYLGTMIDTITDPVEMEFLKTRAEFVEDDTAYFYTICKHLDIENSRCKIYSRRPQFCKDFPNNSRMGDNCKLKLMGEQ